MPPDCITDTPGTKPEIASEKLGVDWFSILVGSAMFVTEFPVSRARCSPAGDVITTASSETAAGRSPKSSDAACPAVTVAGVVAAAYPMIEACT